RGRRPGSRRRAASDGDDVSAPGTARQQRPDCRPTRHGADGDRPAGQRPELPRARRAAPEPGGRPMSSSPDTPGSDTCGCCAGVMPETPAPVENRPGLSAIAYRVGTHSQFKASLLAALASEGPAGLGTRADNDFTVALLDAWAVVADVLTFYHERSANEHYWRTATERRSLVELARLLGYELRPGVAASTFLAFTLETAAGAPGEVSLDPGIKV